MDQLIFYKKSKSLKETIEKIRLSYTRPYTMAFSTDSQILTRHLTRFPKSLLYYFTDILEHQDRVALNQIQAQYPDVKVCLCTHESFALDAWKLHVFHFEAHPITSEQVIDTYKKYIASTSTLSNEFVLKTDEGVRRIPYSSVTHLAASGNYTFFHLTGDKSIIQSRQLHTFEYCTETDLQMQRVHRSLIINLRNVQVVRDGSVKFYGCEKELVISQNLTKKLSSMILGR